MGQIKAIVITCVDYRFQEAIQKWLVDNNYQGLFDRLSIIGALKDIVSPKEEQNRLNLLNQIDTSVKLHNPSEIIIIEHQDCGGYAADGTIPSGLDVDTDMLSHKDFANEAKPLLAQIYPDKTIRILYSSLDGNITEI